MKSNIVTHLWIFPTEQYFEFLDDDGGSLVESLADVLEHDEAHGDADDGVQDDERLPSYSGWSAVAVTCTEKKRVRNVFPLTVSVVLWP